MNEIQNKKIAVALSGGVDSSVTALLLKKQGYEVVGITGKMVNDDNFDAVCKNAKEVADKLKIEHYVLDLSEDFQNNIIDYFINSYKNGETPNPCIVCNKTIKWGKILDYAISELGCNYIATGHYASIKEVDGQFLLYPATDERKDQLYYLYELNQKQLSKTIFPLSGMEKSQIRQIAIDNDLPSKSSKESQDICFIKKPYTTKKFLLEHIKAKQGEFVLQKTGEKIGVHNGAFQYTVGQRKGIGIAYSEPLYVTKTDTQKNIVYCGVKNELLSEGLVLNDFNLHDKNFKGGECFVKIRYNMNAVKAKAEINEAEVKIHFIELVSGITSGQACVIYDKKDGHLIGGSRIKNGEN